MAENERAVHGFDHPSSKIRSFAGQSHCERSSRPGTFKVVYDMKPVAGLDVNYRVLSTTPEGEVRMKEDTVLKLSESAKSW